MSSLISFSPKFKYIFPLLVVMGYLTDSLIEADGNFPMVGDSIRGTLVVLIEAHTSLT